MKTLIALITACWCVGCNSGGTIAPSQNVVRASLAGAVEGVAFRGAVVVQRKTSQKIEIAVPEKAVKLILTTCHREEVLDSPPRAWSYNYVPTMFLENWGSCPITISVVTQQGTLQHAIIDFTSNETLGATVYCNGIRTVDLKGATFCQSRVGLLQKIDFADGKVSALASSGCPEPVHDGYSFQIPMGLGLCVYAFRDLAGGTHRYTTRGYNILDGSTVNVNGAVW